MIIHGWKFEKKVDCSKRPSEKEKKKRKGSWTKEKKMKKKKEKRKNRSAIWTLLCKVSGIDIIWKEKLCSTSL